MNRLTVFAIVAFGASVLLADRITMNSGSVLTGTVKGIKEGVIKFTSDDFGDMDIDPGKVKSIVDSKQTSVQIAELKLIPKDPEVWHGSVNASFLAARGNSYHNSWSLIANLNRRWEKDRFNADFGYYYGESAPAYEDLRKDTDRWEVEVKHDHFWSSKWYTYENARYERDMMQDLEARIRLGLGLGYQWLDGEDLAGTGKWSFNQELGANWIKEVYKGKADTPEEGFCALRYAHHLSWLPALAPTVEAFHNLEFLPQSDDWDKYLIKADVGFTTKIIMNFDLLCKIEWDYNSRPAHELKRSDIRYIAGLGYKW